MGLVGAVAKQRVRIVTVEYKDSWLTSTRLIIMLITIIFDRDPLNLWLRDGPERFIVLSHLQLLLAVTLTINEYLC